MNMHWKVRGWPSASLLKAYTLIPAQGAVLDVGCIGYHQVRIAQHLRLVNLKHYGVDWGDADGLPEGFVFKKADLNEEELPFEDDMFDFVVASHVIEHLRTPVEFFADCLRVCKPGGIAYFEAPSERSLWMPGYMFASRERCYTLSFFDDPTHVRVWTPQAFFRLSLCYGCDPVKTGHLYSWIHRLLAPATIPFCLLTKHPLLETCVWQTVGWASYLIVRKPDNLKGKPPFRYYFPERPFKIKIRRPAELNK
jgi:SAM-dependent methyltransferase